MYLPWPLVVAPQSFLGIPLGGGGGAGAIAEPYNNLWSIRDTTATGAAVASKVWYGDSKAYIGAAVPPGISVAVNITVVPAERAALVYYMIRTNTTTTLSGPGAPALVDPTFLLVVNTAPDASDPVMFAPPNSAVNLTQFHVFTWANVQGFLLPRTQRGIMVNGGGFYLVPVLTWNETDETVSNTPGTWSLRYIMSEALAKRMGAVRTQLQSRLLCQEER